MNFTCEEDKDTKKPIRQCALTRTRSPEDALLRFVLDPEGRVVPDIKRKLPGRGVWITADHSAVLNSVRKSVFSKGFQKAVAAGPELADFAGQLLRQAALQDLALANKAGDAISGYAKVEDRIKKNKMLALMHASDASDDGSAKLDRLARAVSGGKGQDPGPMTCFSSAELSSALGKWNVNHAAIADCGAGRAFLQSAKRYISYMASHPAARLLVDTPEQEKV